MEVYLPRPPMLFILFPSRPLRAFFCPAFLSLSFIFLNLHLSYFRPNLTI